jgi:hypothetical protein
MTAIGPLETQRQARELPQVQAIQEAMRSGSQADMIEANLTMLVSALDEAGVVPGAWERQICEWLAGYEPQTCAAIAALISCANHPGSQS